MKYFEFGQEHPELMVMLPGGGICYQARTDGHHARPVQRGFCVHGAAQRQAGSQNHLLKRL